MYEEEDGDYENEEDKHDVTDDDVVSHVTLTVERVCPGRQEWPSPTRT